MTESSGTISSTNSVGTTDAETIKVQRLRGAIKQILADRFGGNYASASAMLIVGTLLLIVIGFVVATIAYFVLGALMGDWAFSWRTWYVLYFVALVPVLVFEWLRSAPTPGEDADPLDTFQWWQVRSSKLGLLEFVLWAPRMVVEGVRIIQRMNAPDDGVVDHRFELSADLLTLLGSVDGGVDVKTVILPNVSVERQARLMDWMETVGLIGRSTDHSKVWISSELRNEIAKRGILMK
jgi:hypothetical protein